MIGPFHSVILRVLLTPIVASLQLFAIYVVAHGHYSPGGGFQGGVLLGASLILPLLSRGRSHGLFLLTERGAAVMGAIGVLIFALFGLESMIMGLPMLDYSGLPLDGFDASARRSLGILGIEAGVTLAVAGAVVSIFYSLYEDNEEATP